MLGSDCIYLVVANQTYLLSAPLTTNYLIIFHLVLLPILDWESGTGANSAATDYYKYDGHDLR